MKSKFLIPIVIILLGSLWFYANRTNELPSQTEEPSNTKHESKSPNSVNAPQMTLEQASVLLSESDSTRNLMKQLLELPVEFYGQILDQNDNPVVRAKITCYTLPLGPMGASRVLLSADPDGRFEVQGFNAGGISFSVEAPTGYRRTSESTKDIRISDSLEKIRLTEEYKKLPPEAKVCIDSPVFMAMAGLPEGLPTYKADKAKPMIFRLTKL